MRRVYMDYAAASPVDPRVLDEMKTYFDEKFGNPSSVYSLGFEAADALEKARQKVAGLIGADSKEIIFTSCGTESNNLALQGVARAMMKKGKHVITSSIEHPSVLSVCEALQKEGFEISYVSVDSNGTVKMDEIEEFIRKDTILISIMYANHEVGSIQPIKEIGSIARENEIPLHVDAVAAAGKIPIDVERDRIDLLSMASQDIYGPKGIAALYLRSGVRIRPILYGGRQERRIRPGTENVPFAVGFGKAVGLAKNEMEGESNRLTKYRDRLIDGILESTKESYLNGGRENRLPNNVNVRFRYIEGESTILNLDMLGISAATGSACTSETLEPSHVLTAMGIPPEDAHGSVQFTLGRWTKEDDIEYVLEKLPGVVSQLRAMSPMTPRGFED